MSFSKSKLVNPSQIHDLSFFLKKDSLVISTRKRVMIVSKVLCGGADSGSAGGAQRCEPGEVKFHPSGEAQQDIPSYPLFRMFIP